MWPKIIPLWIWSIFTLVIIILFIHSKAHKLITVMKKFTLEFFLFCYLLFGGWGLGFFFSFLFLPEAPLHCPLSHLFPAHDTLTIPPLPFEYINKIINFSSSKPRVFDLISLACMRHDCLKWLIMCLFIHVHVKQSGYRKPPLLLGQLLTLQSASQKLRSFHPGNTVTASACLPEHGRHLLLF